MDNQHVKKVKEIVVRFSGDSGDGMQLTGNIFSNLTAIFGNQICTHPDFPSEIRAPIGTVAGVSGFQIKLGSTVFTSGDQTDVLVAMNPAALKVCANQLKKHSIIIVDSDSFSEKDLEKADFKTEDPFKELNLETQSILDIPISSLTKESLKDFDLDQKSKLRCKNMFALGLVCWLFNQELSSANSYIENKFSKNRTLVDANEKVLFDGYNYGHNQHLNVSTFEVETKDSEKGDYIDINGNEATAWGLVAASENSSRNLFLGSYPITPATDVLHELTKLKNLNVKAIQAEDEIAAIAMSIGAAFAGDLAATSTSGPGLALKGEAIGLAVMSELPLVIIDVQRSGPSTGMPTKSEQTDLNQALYGRNGESPLVVVAAKSSLNCFDMSYWAAKLAMEFMTPAILLTDGHIGNGSSAWKIPDMDKLPEIKPHDVSLYKGKSEWNIASRDSETGARYWAKPGLAEKMHRIGGLENHLETGGISTDPENHAKKTALRRHKINNIANFIPEQTVEGNADGTILLVSWGGTYGYVKETIDQLNAESNKYALAHFTFICPLPKNTEEILRKYKKIIVIEQNEGQFASYLKSNFEDIKISQINKVDGQPFNTLDLKEKIIKL